MALPAIGAIALGQIWAIALFLILIYAYMQFFLSRWDRVDLLLERLWVGLKGNVLDRVERIGHVINVRWHHVWTLIDGEWDRVWQYIYQLYPNLRSYAIYLHGSTATFINTYFPGVADVWRGAKDWLAIKSTALWANLASYSTYLHNTVASFVNDPFKFLFDIVKRIIESLLTWLFDRLLWLVETLW